MKIYILDKSWNQVKQLISPLDLVLFHTKSGNRSVGIIVNSIILPHIKELDPNEWYVWGSTSSLCIPGFENEPSDIFGKNRIGVQIRNLKSVLDSYNGDISIGKLMKNPILSEQENQWMKEIIATIIQRQIDQEQYEKYNVEEEMNKIIQWIEDEMNNHIATVAPVVTVAPVATVRIHPTDFENMDQTIKNLQNDIDALIKELEEPIQPPFHCRTEIERRIHIYRKQKEIDAFRQSKEFQKHLENLKQIYEIYGSRIYNKRTLDFLSSLYPKLRIFRNWRYAILKKVGKWVGSEKIKCNDLYCSEFVAIIYSKLGIVPSINDFRPVDYDQFLSVIFKITKK